MTIPPIFKRLWRKPALRSVRVLSYRVVDTGQEIPASRFVRVANAPEPRPSIGYTDDFRIFQEDWPEAWPPLWGLLDDETGHRWVPIQIAEVEP